MRNATLYTMCCLFLSLCVSSISLGQTTWTGVSQAIRPPTSTRTRHAQTGNDIPSAMISLAARFERTPTSSFVGEWSFRDIVARLNAAGIPTLLDRRALEDEDLSDVDDTIEIPTANLSLPERLTHALDEHGCDWTISHRGNAIVVSSQSRIEVEALFPVTHDVTTITGNRGSDSIIDAITTNIEPNAWDDVGGPGSVTPLEIRGRTLLVVSQHYKLQRAVQRFLRSVDQIGGPSIAFRRRTVPQQTNMATASTPVTMPSQAKRRGINLPSSGSNSNMGGFGGGMGGGMGMGGMF